MTTTIDRDEPVTVKPGRAAKADRKGPRRRISARTVINTITILVLLYLVLGPLIMLVVSAFEDTSGGVVITPPFPWTGANFDTVFTSSETYSVLWTTVLFSGGALIFAFAVSLTFAWLVERTDMPARNTIFVLVVAPQGMPALISAIAWSLLLNPTNGFLNEVLRSVFHLSGPGPLNVYSLPWMILVQGMALVPLTFLLVTASLRGMNASLEDAARTSGSGFWTIARKVTLPLLRPAIIGALVYEFVTVVEAVDIPLVLGLPGHVTVLSTQIYNASHPPVGLPNYGVGSTYGIFLLILALAPLLFYNKIIGNSSDYVTVTGKTFRPKIQELGRLKPWAMLFSWGYIFVSFALPLLILIWASIQPYFGTLSRDALKRVTVKSYKSTLSSDLFATALKNTIILGLATAAGSMILAMLVSWIIVRSRSRFRWMADVLAFLPHAIPGVVIGLSTLLIYLILPIPVYGTIWIIAIAMGTQYVSLGTRLTTGGIAQIQRSLEEAAEASGAKQRHVWRRVLVPLLRPVFFNGFLMVFLASIQNLTLPLMLYSTGNLVLSSLIYTRWDYGDATGTAVLSVVMTAITIVAALFLRGAGGRRAGD
ncbi:MAG: iron(III) transport system permease protein [Pseudonocardiales bacterium]|nr:iron(III) transport system permease protein [Pseudonocardiales bacterium]MDT4980634.1 iron(III) transport system permease protein [Pseudonocardiales bacterium]